MIKSASEIRSAARTALSGHWAEAAMFTFVCYLASWAIGAVSTGLELIVPGASMLVILLVLPMGWGYSVAFLGNRRGAEDPFNVSHLLDGYKDFSRIFTTILLMQLYTFLWALLLIVPGIIKGLSYSMTCFVLCDNPDMKNNEAIELSMKMMDGHKTALFWLYLTFIGWGILCIFTFGIGYFWLAPYMQASLAQFYEEVKEDYITRYALA